MTRRQLKKAAYKAILKENKSHQETFDELVVKAEIEKEKLADDVSKVPSTIKMQEQKTLIYSYVAVLGLIIIMRGTTIAGFGFSEQLDLRLVGLMIILGMAVPALGIWASLTGRMDQLVSVGILLGISVLRSFTNGHVQIDSTILLFLIPVAVAIVLSFYLPTRMKTPYKKQINKEEIDGRTHTRVEYKFAATGRVQHPEIVDDIL